MTEPSTQPQFSPDGRWKWDGHTWIPNDQPGYPAGPGYFPAAPGYPATPSYPAYGAPQPSAHDGKAIGSLVCALVGCGIGSIAAVVLGHMSRSEAKRQNREPSGLALAGLIIGYLGIAAMVAILGVFAVGASVQGVFEETSTCSSTPAEYTCQ